MSTCFERQKTKKKNALLTFLLESFSTVCIPGQDTMPYGDKEETNKSYKSLKDIFGAL